MEVTREEIIEALRTVIDPDLKKDIVSLERVKNVHLHENKVAIELETTNPTMHVKKKLQDEVVNAIKSKFSDIEVLVNMVVNTADRTARPILPGVKNIIAVASGKGGVGKSTVSSNLAVAMAEQGAKVGLVDADIYGPSIPLMFDVVHEKPQVKHIDGKQMMIPVESYGVKLLSIGFFTQGSEAVVWRGPMASRALTQMFTDAHWGELDYLILDLPPGTGDIHLTLVQTVPVTGAIVVSTPQVVALSDAEKGVNMFRLPSVNVPVLGLVENMAWFTPEELPDNKYYIFGKDGVKHLAEKLQVPLLGQIPLVQGIREAGDIGRPAILQQDTPSAVAFRELAGNVMQQVAIRNNTLDPTKKVEIGK